MTDEEILAELRTIRTLLALDKEEQLTGLVNDLSEIQTHVLEELSGEGWSSIPTSDIADEHRVSTETVRSHVRDLVDGGLVERQGEGSATEYHETGLLHAAELVNKD